MMFTIVGILAVAVLLGSAIVLGGVRYFRFPPRVLTIAFALTAVSWVAFLIVAIGTTIILLGFPSA